MSDFVPIPGFVGYVINEVGEIRGRYDVDRVVNNEGRDPRTSLIYEGKMRTFLISRLVACAFHGMPIESELEVHHRDENPQNNHKDNLQVVTHDEHQIIHHGHVQAEKTDTHRTCIACGESKPLDQFYTRNNGSTRTRCKVCYRLHTAAQSKARAITA